MKRRSWVIIFTSLLAVIILAFLLWVHKNLSPFYKGPDTIVVPEFPYSEMLPGDLAFRTGTGLYSKMLNAASTDTVYYSHIGLVAQLDSQWVIIHAVPQELDGPSDFERVKMESVKQFFDPSYALHGELVHTGLVAGRDMIDAAVGFVRDSIRFDGAFNLTDSSKLYCTELLWLLYRREGIDLSEGRRSHRGFPSLGEEGCISPTDLYRYSGNKSYFKY